MGSADQAKSKVRLCPFCGKKNSTTIKTHTEFYILCEKCGACSGLRKTENCAKRAWNKRIYDYISVEGKNLTDVIEE